MSWPYLHALINHFPIVLSVIGFLTLILAMITSRRGIWNYALATLTLAGITVYPAAFTGHRAARAVHGAWYIAPGAVHAHSQASDFALWIVLATGLVALISWITMLRTRAAVSPGKMLRIVLGILAIFAVSTIVRTGILGGRIVVESPILQRPTPPLAAPAKGTPATAPATGSVQPAAPASAAPPTGTAARPPAHP